MRSADEIKGIREACLIGRRILDAAHAAVRPGVTTDEIDRVVSIFSLRHLPAYRRLGTLTSLCEDDDGRFLDVQVHEATIAEGAYPSPLNYCNFPKSVCTSVNEVS